VGCAHAGFRVCRPFHSQYTGKPVAAIRTPAIARGTGRPNFASEANGALLVVSAWTSSGP